MSYTGNVSVGGAADTRELPGLTITKVAVGPMDNNAYLLRCTQTGELALIDAANEADTLLGLIGDTPLATIITTHQHWDHHAALAGGAAGHRCGHCRASRGRAGTCRSRLPGRCRTATRSPSGTPGCRSFTCAGIRLAASRCFYDGNGELADQPHLFTGDSLFPGGPGNTEKRPCSGSGALSRISRSGSSPKCRTAPGCIRATARTRRSAPSARTCRSGAPAAGKQAATTDRT